MSKKSFSYLVCKYSRNIYRFLPTFLDNCYVFLFQREPHWGPLAVVWDVTSQCNTRCIFCDWWKVGKDILFPERKELKTTEKIEIIKKLAKAGVWLLSLCGGEPLLCSDLDLLIKEAKASGMLVNISTNGFLLEEKAEILVDSGVDFIMVSIDGHNPELHDTIRGHKGLFAQIEKGIERIRALSTAKRIYIEARYLINKMNGFALEDFVDFWLDKVDFIIFKPIYENPFVLYRIPESMRFQPEDEYKFRDYFQNFLKKYPVFDNPYNRKIPDFLFNPKPPNDDTLCFVGTFFAGLDCQGNLYPCQELTVFDNKPLGNLLRDDFLALWNSKDLNRLRKCFRQGLHCNCWMDRFILNIYLDRFLKPLSKFFKIGKI